MKVVIAHRSGQPKVVELPEPSAGRNFITVRVSHSAMRLPDELIALERAGHQVKRGEDGFPLGGTASGTIIECGPGVTRLKSGLRVAVTGAPYVYHAAQLVVPENLAVELPKKVNHEEGAYVGQGATALQILRTSRLQLGESCVVMGADMLGLLTAQLIRAAGGVPVLIDESEYRLNKARTVGVVHAFTPGDDALIRTIEQLTDGEGADSVVLTTPGAHEDFVRGGQLLRPGGVLVLGVPLAGQVSLDALREKNLEIRSAIGGGPGFGDKDFEVHNAGYPRALARWTERENMACFSSLLADRRVQVSPLISDRIPMERANIAYEKAARGRDVVLGVVLTL